MNTQSSRKSPGVTPMLTLWVFMLALSIAASGWVYFEGNRAIRAEVKATEVRVGLSPEADGLAGLVRRMDAWAVRLTAASVVSSVGLVGVMVVVLGRWGRHLKRLTAEHEDGVRQVRESGVQVQRLTNDRKKIEEELRQLQEEIEQRVEERTATLAKAYATMEQELNERRHAEKLLAMQSKELERSKGVLELHVQARTQELQKLQRRYESILNSAGEGIYGLDLQGRATFVNPAAAKLTGWKVEELVGKGERDVFRLAPTGDAPTEQVFHRRDGSVFPVEYVRTPIKEGERLVGEVVIFKDITERKRTEDALARKAAELARSNAELEQFAFVASHDLQEPLRKIQSFGDRLKTKVEAAKLADGRDYLERMQSAAARMQNLINDLLTFSRVISASQPFVPVDLNAVVKGVLSDLEVRIEQSKAQVEVGPLPTIDADPMQMRQIFQNLIGNALKFQAPNHQPVVKVQAQVVPRTSASGENDPAEALCELTVQDNGIGFDEKYMDKIFAVFQRLHGRNEYEGTGVGLAVCRRITDRHGGTITARSKPGEGATFTISLPVGHVKRQADPAATPAEAPGADAAPASVPTPPSEATEERIAA